MSVMNTNSSPADNKENANLLGNLNIKPNNGQNEALNWALPGVLNALDPTSISNDSVNSSEPNSAISSNFDQDFQLDDYSSRRVIEDPRSAEKKVPLGESKKMLSDSCGDKFGKDLEDDFPTMNDTMSPSEKTAPATPLKIESTQDLIQEFER